MGDNNTNTTTNAAPPQTPSAPLARKRLMVKPKMDFAKALSIMGFSTSRTLDPSGGHDAKVELNAALSRKMADIEKRKRMANKKEQTKVEDKLRDEIRTLHEAYQFLSRKYIRLQELRRAEEVDDEDPDNAGRRGMNLLGRKKSNKPQLNHKESLEDLMSQIEDEDDDEDDDDFDFENGGGDGTDAADPTKTPKKKKLNRKKSSIRFKKKSESNLNNITEEAGGANSEESNAEPDEEVEDDVFAAIEDITNMEVNLCQLINETFKFDEDYELYDITSQRHF